VRRDLLVQAAWSKAGIPEEHLRKLLATAPATDFARAAPVPVDRGDWREELLCLLLAKPELRVKAGEQIEPGDFASPVHRTLLAAMLAPESRGASATALLGRNLELPVRQELSRLTALPLDVENVEAAFAAYVLKIRRQRLQGEAARLVAEMGVAERGGDAEEVARLSKKHLAVRREWIRLGKGGAGQET
jgi:hypothetical protein